MVLLFGYLQSVSFCHFVVGLLLCSGGVRVKDMGCRASAVMVDDQV